MSGGLRTLHAKQVGHPFFLVAVSNFSESLAFLSDAVTRQGS